MECIAQMVKRDRNAMIRERDEHGVLLNHVTSIAHLGGATLGNEANYLVKKLFSDLGVV